MRVGRMLRKADRWDFLLVLIALTLVMQFLRYIGRDSPPPASLASPPTTKPPGMDELWLEASLGGKKDMRPLADPEIIWKEPKPWAPEPAPSVPAVADPAAEPAPSFPAYRQPSEPQKTQVRPRIAPMQESFLKDAQGRASSSVFLENPKPPNKMDESPVAAPAPVPTAPAKARSMRRLAGH